ncbi:hypothetical protein J5N97_027506 [Dioscorea zingiberensis]|uniref:5-methyltetrahydropteroyltriglutamate--homocysteine S-methyltransferase n=1 Tax=Dioscorea zingiberensis TaxID=325984 RepID=A0A9D5C4V3_9LILI|nr:hypothetical protein J5N97_027506 [Dioscorea zingiberensis]
MENKKRKRSKRNNEKIMTRKKIRTSCRVLDHHHGSTSIQTLFIACKSVFKSPNSTVPLPLDHVNMIHLILDEMTPEDVGLSSDLLLFKSKPCLNGTPRITYTTVYQCSNFSLCLFFLPPGGVIPLHNHPGMTVFTKLLIGSMHVKSYDWIHPVQSNQLRSAKIVVDSVFTAPCKSSILYPNAGGNIHCVTAITQCVFLDVIGPPYSSEDGRDCSYYKEHPTIHFQFAPPLRLPFSFSLSPPPPSLLATAKGKMAGHIVGYPRMGPKRELKFALESFWDGKSTAEDLQKVAADLRASIWKQMADAGIKYIPSNSFSYYDQVLDTTAMLGAVPPRYGWKGGEIGFDTYFSMARGNASLPAMEMTKWFDTNYHYIVPELGPDTNFSYSSHKAVSEYKEAKALGIETMPVLIGPVSYLLLSKPAKGVEKSFSPLSLLGKVLAVYKEVLAELKAAGAIRIQFDEPTLVMDLGSHQLQAFTDAYSELESSFSGLYVLIQTYFADVPEAAYKTITSLNCFTGFGFDLVRGTKTIDLIKSGFPSGKYLVAGVVDGRNIWANDLASSLSTLEGLEAIVGKGKLVVSTSCSLMHTAVDLVNETKLDDEIKSWLAFAAQKVVEVNALARALAGDKDVAFFSANAAAQASRKSSPRVTNQEVQQAAAALKGSDHRRVTTVSARLDAQQKKLNLPILPTTTIGSFPQTMDLRRVRREYKANKISEEEYVKAIKEEINKVVKLQEELDIDVLVHGEPERNDMVEYFGEQLSGFAFTSNGWVQSYGSRCVKPPIIYGDVSRPKAMTVFWSSMAQSMTSRPMKGMLTGPVTILNWSFVRNDQPRFETCYQIALAIKKEVEDLEAAGIQVIQIDEAALREGLPLRKSEHAFYLDWAVHSFRITNCGVQDTTQIHTHMCYSNFNDIIHSIINMDADVITIENSRSDEKLLSVFREGVKYGAGIGPGVYDIHSPRIPSTEEIADRINKMLAVLETNILWVNPDCGLKTRKYAEVKPALTNMVAAAKLLRKELASAK